MFWKLAPVALLCLGHLAYASTITFDGSAIYYAFVDTKPLSGQYGSTGVSFSGMNGNGGSILDQFSGFGIDAHSGTQFLAFNNVMHQTGTGEVISFAAPQSSVSIYAGLGTSATYTLNAFSNLQLVGTQTLTVPGGVYGLLSVDAPQITSMTIASDSNYFVLDDLNYTAAATPEPSSLLLLLTGALGMAGTIRRRLANSSK